MRLRVLGVPVVSLTLWTSAQLAASPALACSAALVCRKLDQTAPVDQASDVPRNVELRVTYEQVDFNEEGTAPTLQTQDGTAVALTWERTPVRTHADRVAYESWVGHSAEPLAANTTYELRHAYATCGGDAGAARCNDGLCSSAQSAVIATFTTGGDSLPSTSLAAPVLGALSAPSFQSESSSSTCGPYHRCVHQVSLPRLAEGQALRVYQGDALLLPALIGKQSLTISSHLGSSNGFPGASDLNHFGAAIYQFHVVDAAGHRSPATSLTVPACAQPVGEPSDGGVDSGAPLPPDAMVGLDAGAHPDAGAGGAPSAADDSDGCALTSSRHGSSAPAWYALAMLALVFRVAVAEQPP